MSLLRYVKETQYPIFFHREPLEETLFLEERHIHHLRVRRELENGQKLFVVHNNEVCLAEISLPSSKKVLVHLLKQESIEPRVEQLTLFIPPIKQDLFHLCLQKAVELGVDRICPLITEYTQKKDVYKKKESLETIIELACHQSRQLTRPELGDIVKINALNPDFFDLMIVADWQTEKKTLPDLSGVIKKPNCQIACLVGPEGGWSTRDKIFLKPAVPICLSENILRTETATILLCSLAKNLLSNT